MITTHLFDDGLRKRLAHDDDVCVGCWWWCGSGCGSGIVGDEARDRQREL